MTEVQKIGISLVIYISVDIGFVLFGLLFEVIVFIKFVKSDEQGMLGDLKIR